MGDVETSPDPGVVLPPDVSYDEKKMVLHKLDSLSLLLYTFLLTLTVVTIWLFKHRYHNTSASSITNQKYSQESRIHPRDRPRYCVRSHHWSHHQIRCT